MIASQLSLSITIQGLSERMFIMNIPEYINFLVNNRYKYDFQDYNLCCFWWLLFDCFQFPKNHSQAPLETGVAHSWVGLGALPIVPGRLNLLLPVKALGKDLKSLFEGS